MAKMDIGGCSREMYTEWIKKLRHDSNLNQAEFGKLICHFEKKNGEEYCFHYNRNSVCNWEKGKNLPTSPETFVSLALLDYELNGNPERERYAHVQQLMMKYLKRRLYCRNINDALLIMAVNGVYSIEIIPEIRKSINQQLCSVKVTKEEKVNYSLERATENIEKVLCRIKNGEDFMKLVLGEDYRIYFFLGGRTVGERLKKIFEGSDEYSKVETVDGRRERVNFNNAVAVYVPKCRDSYNRIFSSDVCVSRQWLIDFCIHMRLNREDIQTVLKSACMEGLSENVTSYEAFIKEETGSPVGSVKWYDKMAERFPKEWGIRYKEAKALSITEKLAFSVFLTQYLDSMVETKKEMMPVDYLLDCLFSMKVWDQLMDKMKDLTLKCHDEISENPKKMLADPAEHFSDYFVYEIDNEGKIVPEKVQKFYDTYRREFERYFCIPEKKYQGIQKDDTLNKLYALAAVTYSLFTGKLYKQLAKEDLKELKSQLLNHSKDMEPVYLFFNNLWVIFLGKERIQIKEQTKFYCIKDKKRTRTMCWETVREDIVESWLLAEECYRKCQKSR